MGKIKTWVFNEHKPLSKTDMLLFEGYLRSLKNSKESNALASIRVAMRKVMLKEYAYRVMYRGAKYPEGKVRPNDTFPVWSDPDEDK